MALLVAPKRRIGSKLGKDANPILPGSSAHPPTPPPNSFQHTPLITLISQEARGVERRKEKNNRHLVFFLKNMFTFLASPKLQLPPTPLPPCGYGVGVCYQHLRKRMRQRTQGGEMMNPDVRSGLLRA